MARTLQELCALMGGHQQDPEHPERCLKCHAPLRSPRPPPVVVEEPAAEPDFDIDEVRPLEAPARQRPLALCHLFGHIPNPFGQGTCFVCLARISFAEVDHG